MDYAWFLFGFKGRINRARYWLAVLAMGVFLGASTQIIDRDSGKVYIGEVPEYAVVVPGSRPARPLKDGSPGPALSCAVIVKTVDEQTRSKTSINELLRD